MEELTEQELKFLLARVAVRVEPMTTDECDDFFETLNRNSEDMTITVIRGFVVSLYSSVCAGTCEHMRTLDRIRKVSGGRYFRLGKSCCGFSDVSE